MNSKKQRDRGRILTFGGLSRLQQAIRAWELEHEVRCTQERIRELTSAIKEGGLDPGTIRKILKAKEGVDPESIRCLFTTFGLQLSEADLVSSSRLQIQADPNFVGREGAIGDLNTLINRGAKVIVIQARGGVGKTTLARKYLQQEFDSYLEFPIAKETKDIASIESLIEEKLRQLGEEPGREFFVSLDRLKRKLQNQRIGILIDNLEPALDSAGKFIEPHRRYVELLRVLASLSVQAVTLITSRERLNEYSISMQHYLLEELSLEAWNQFFQHRFVLFAADRDIADADHTALTSLHKAYGGNAKAMDILCGVVLTDYSSNINAYWQANQDDLLIELALEDLVVGQFDRLQQLDLNAYKLLLRMGVYRYQNTPTVPIQGLLCLLWDIPQISDRQRAIRALQARSLVDSNDGEFWIHPVIRAQAVERLRLAGDLEIANRKAAEFWTNVVESIETVGDAKKAFEAYYHYLEIQDNEKAGNVIIKDRKNRWSDWEEGECLGHSLYKLGLIQEANFAINLAIGNISPGYPLSRLYSILGLLHRFTGNVHQAIEYHETSGRIARSIFRRTRRFEEANINPEKLIAASLLDKGLCKIELWEIQEALESFEEARKYLEESPFQDYKLEANYCINFLNSLSSSENKNSLSSFADQIYKDLEENDFGAWTRGYGLCFLGLTYKNLGTYEKAFLMYRKATEYAQNANYNLIRAKALCGLAELFRVRQSFVEARSNHLEAINLLHERGNKSDLAEAYYQLGLTYQAIGENEKSNKEFQEAIQLFSEMEAPKQVERVMQSMITKPSH